ncbi:MULTISPECIES: DUF7660 family protein [Paenibacillus]|jgi:hypothetical protein|uniref:DUF7660 family protein n=1 Tax=Paenibacillus TaxID=44249 RepID=UPI0004F5DE42|nr:MULTISPECIES: hypothetical protein [unclassified Paenibacillus]AIQ28479.1 hypothetical protein P40081_10045 [Paenibacillus sp. FSL P4-0081]OMF33293.1 hypothetical protein BK132_03530 [Paenibacillus sp. FSL H8-0259]
MELYNEIKKVSDKDLFTEFIGMLIKDFKLNPDVWENRDIESFLEGIKSWVEDMEGYYENNNLQIPQVIDWNFLANLFYVGRVYE